MSRRELQGRVVQVLTGTRPESLITTDVERAEVGFDGFEGDRHAGLTHRSGGRTPHYPRGTEIRNTRQVSIVSTEELREIAERMALPELRPEYLGANLLLAGIPALTRLPPSTRLLFPSGAALAVEAENKPCILAGQAIQDQHPACRGLAELFPAAARGRRGLVAWVERPGFIARDDPVLALIPELLPYEF